MSGVSVAVISAAITVLVLGVAGVFWLMQNPLAGMFGSNESTVESTQSTEWTGATIPNYVGKNYNDVIKSIPSDSNITIYRNYTDEYSDKYDEGIVMEQDPPAGSKVTQEDDILISITVSKGKQMRELPDIEGEKLDEAAADIADQGLLATAEYEYSNTVAEGRVIGYKQHEAGDTLEYGTNVTIIVSRGTEESAATQSVTD